MQLSDIKRLLPQGCDLSLTLNINHKYITVKIEDADLAYSDEDLKDRVLNPAIQILIRTAKNV